MYKKYVKRIFDFSLSVVLFVLLLPLFVIISVLVKGSSKGPVLFMQTRYGIDSKPFTLLKFRSMREGAPIVSAQEVDTTVTNQITKIGSFLRASSLDELPELLNIIVGDMSFIGPRPLADVDFDTLQLRKDNGADQVRPGISGLAQVNGRNMISACEKANYDKEYADSVSLALDLHIIGQTVYHVLLRTGITKEG